MLNIILRTESLPELRRLLISVIAMAKTRKIRNHLASSLSRSSPNRRLLINNKYRNKLMLQISMNRIAHILAPALKLEKLSFSVPNPPVAVVVSAWFIDWNKFMPNA